MLQKVDSRFQIRNQIQEYIDKCILILQLNFLIKLKFCFFFCEGTPKIKEKAFNDLTNLYSLILNRNNI